MVKTLSTMLDLGTPAPDFLLKDVTTGGEVSLSTFSEDTALLVMFICRHCPFVKHVQHELAKIGADYLGKGLGIVAISSNDIKTHPEDAPELLKQMAAELRLTFPFVFDETQEVAKAYTAACTPDFFLFDADRALVYRGQLDDSRPESGIPVTGRDLRLAIEATLAGRPIDDDQAPSIGCNIKWKPGNAPSYFG